MVKAAVAFWHVVRESRAVFDTDWSPRMGVFWPGLMRSCVHSSSEKSPLLFADMRSFCVRGAAGWADLRLATLSYDLPSVGCALGQSDAVSTGVERAVSFWQVQVPSALLCPVNYCSVGTGRCSMFSSP